GQDHSHRLLETDLSRETVQPAAERHCTDQRLGQSETGGVGRYDDVARERELEAAAKGHTVYCGDDGLEEVEPLDTAGITVLRIAAARDVGSLCSRLEIAAGAESPIARTGDDADALVGVGGKGVERCLQLEVHRLVQRIHDLRPIQGYRRDMITRFD